MLPSARRATELLHRRSPHLTCEQAERALVAQGWSEATLVGLDECWRKLCEDVAPAHPGLLPPLPEEVLRLAQSEQRSVPEVSAAAPLADAVEAMWRAVLMERDAVRAGAANDRLALVEGREAGRTGERWVYRFVPLGTARLSDGATGRLKAAGHWLDAEVITARGREVTVAVSGRIDSPEAAELEVDAAFLLDRLAERLRQTSCFPSRVGWGDRLFEPSSAPPVPQHAPVPLAHPLTGRQGEAADHAAQYERTYLWGPPGTGKTTTVAELVAGLVAAGRSVLLVSTTNAAVDVAALRTIGRLAQPGAVAAGTCVRVGAPADLNGYAALGQPVLLSELVAEQGAPAVLLRAALLDTKRELRTQDVRLRRQVARPADLRGELARHREEVRGRDRRVQAAKVAVRNAEAYLRSLRRRADAVRPRDLSTAEADVAAALQCLAQAEAEPSVGPETPLVAALESAVREAALAEQRLDAVAVLWTQVEEQLRTVERSLQAVRRRVVETARLVCATAHQSYLDEGLFLREFDHVVIDEASMMPLPLAWMAGSRARHGVVVAGDFRQLPPIVAGEADQIAQWYAPDAFTVAQAESAAGRIGTCMVALEEQHRMQPAIRAMVGALSYPDLLLRDGAGVRPPTTMRVTQDAVLTLVDTSALAPWVARARGRRSRWNLLHAQVVSSLVAQLIEAGDIAGAEEIAFVTPYSAHAQLLSAAVEHVLDGPETDVASTVHRYQGAERDVVVVDLAAARGMKPDRHWFAAAEPRDEGARLLNVAMSRARQHLVVVADAEHLRGGGPYVQRLLAHLRREGRTLRPHEVQHPSGGVQIDKGELLERLFADIDAAVTDVHVTLAAGAAHDVRALVQRLLGAARRGVAVRLVAGSGVDDTVEALRTDAVVVDRRSPVQEDVAVIDGTLVWGRGSSLLRAPGPPAVRSVSPVLAARVTDLARRSRLSGAPVPADEHASPPCPACGTPMWRLETRWPTDVCRSVRCSRPVPQQRTPVPEQHDAVQAVRMHQRTAGTIRMGDFD